MPSYFPPTPYKKGYLPKIIIILFNVLVTVFNQSSPSPEAKDGV